VQVDLAELDAAFSRAFGQNLRDARMRKGWSQRHLAEVLEARGIRLDPSAVTRIERGSRDVKLREATVMAGCLDVDLQQLLAPPGADSLALILELLRNAESSLRSGRSAFADMAINIHAADALLRFRPDLLQELRHLRSADEDADVYELLVEEVQASAVQKEPVQISDADRRLLDLLQEVVNATVKNMFTGAETFVDDE
jgi:transcriptional regulator with XRE-family HTH domain